MYNLLTEFKLAHSYILLLWIVSMSISDTLSAGGVFRQGYVSSFKDRLDPYMAIILLDIMLSKLPPEVREGIDAELESLKLEKPKQMNFGDDPSDRQWQQATWAYAVELAKKVEAAYTAYFGAAYEQYQYN